MPNIIRDQLFANAELGSLAFLDYVISKLNILGIVDCREIS
jgi:hypothetical protein